MRLALIPAAALVALTPALAACGGGEVDAGPERKSAAGEVLGGEVSDDMLPLDTVRSTSPAGSSGTAGPDETPRPAASPRPTPAIPRPEIRGGPEPYVPSGSEDTPVPSPTSE